jgi:hypothetical protein
LLDAVEFFRFLAADWMLPFDLLAFVFVVTDWSMGAGDGSTQVSNA